MGFSDSAVCSALLASNLDKISALQLLIGPDTTTPTTAGSASGAAARPHAYGTTPHPSTNQHNAAHKNRRKKGLYSMFSKALRTCYGLYRKTEDDGALIHNLIIAHPTSGGNSSQGPFEMAREDLQIHDDFSSKKKVD
ncbi:unnamed protein product [Schistocephalus solidus]|uniref:UBA domain-containing protein n=1 Tax=Schistocephalus solidus TaxID=70667 RepID=A0A183SRP4_SCHSO|nr:unnamed protein product [Schistocephalus solidus]